jgi:hypothetical protein
MEAVRSPETLISIYKSARRYNPEDTTSASHSSDANIRQRHLEKKKELLITEVDLKAMSNQK